MKNTIFNRKIIVSPLIVMLVIYALQALATVPLTTFRWPPPRRLR